MEEDPSETEEISRRDMVGLRYLFEILYMQNDIIVGNDELGDGCGESEEPSVGKSHFLARTRRELLIESRNDQPE